MAGKDDEESFMSLEDEVVKPIKSKTQKKAKKPVEKASEKFEVLDAEILDTTVVEHVGGKYEVDWPLIGMDCPDCASKAMRCLLYTSPSPRDS